jgi:hypothetical protein
MAKKIQGITISLDGEVTGLQKALKNVDKTSSELNSELKSVQRLLKFNPESTELLAQKQKLLGDQVANTKKRLDSLKQAEKEVQEMFERGDIKEKEYRSFQREIIATEGRLKHFKKELDSVDDGRSLDNVEEDLKEVKVQADKAEKSVSRMGSSFGTAAKGAAALGAAGVAATGGLVTGMEDYNRLMARLNSNARNAGFNPELIENQTRKVAALTGEMDSAVETVSNLMQTDLSDEQISTVLDEINGAAIRFSETLKTEGIADGLQETLATGKAIGPFAELLERSGVDLEKFDEGLAKAGKSGKATNYVLKQLSDLGLSSTYEEYKKLNPEIFAQEEAQQRLQKSLSELSITLTPLVTTVSDFLTNILEWVNGNIELVKSFDSISEGLDVLIPKLAEQGLGIIQSIIQSITQNLPMILETGIQILTQLIQGLITMLPQLMTMAQTFITTIGNALNENLPTIIEMGIQLLTSLIQGIVQMLPNLLLTAMQLLETIVNTLIDNLPKIIDTGVELLLSLIDGIVEVLPELIKMGTELIQKLSEELIRNLPDIIDAGMKILLALLDGLVEIMPDLQDAAWDIINTIISEVKDVDWGEIGANIIEGMTDGVLSVGKGLLNAVTGVVENAIEGAKNLLGIASPSKVFKQFGVYTGEGFEIGMRSQIGAISRASDKMVEASLPSIPSIGSPSMNVSGNSSSTPQTSTMNFEGMFKGANFHVRSDDDIRKLAQELARYTNRNKGRAGLA